jgi:hypothetical protein
MFHDPIRRSLVSCFTIWADPGKAKLDVAQRAETMALGGTKKEASDPA